MKRSNIMVAGLLAVGLAVGGMAYAPAVLAGTENAPVVAQKAEDKDDAAVLSQAKVTADQARESALQQYPGANVISVTLEDEDGTPTYSVLLNSSGQQLDVKVNAITGKLVRAENDQEGEAESD